MAFWNRKQRAANDALLHAEAAAAGTERASPRATGSRKSCFCLGLPNK